MNPPELHFEMNSHPHPSPENITPWIVILVVIFATPALLILFILITPSSKPEGGGQAREQHPELVDQEPLDLTGADRGHSDKAKIHHFSPETSPPQTSPKTVSATQRPLSQIE